MANSSQYFQNLFCWNWILIPIKTQKYLGHILVNEISNQASVEMKHDSTKWEWCSLVAV